MIQLELPIVATQTGLRRAFQWLQETLDASYWTRRMHADNARYLLEWFAREYSRVQGRPCDDVPVTWIRYPQLRAYYDSEKRRGLAKESIRKRLCTLKMALREACAHDVIERLPEWPVIRSDIRPKDAFWTTTQYEAARLACDDDELRAWIDLGWWTGMHQDDLDRARWEDIRWEQGTWLRRNTKSKADPLDLPMPARLRALLWERREAIQPHNRDLISGRRMGNCNRVLADLCERAGIPRISTIGLRHSCETYLEECGTTELFQMTWLGLKSPRMIKRHYRHVTEPTVVDGVARLNARNA